VRPARTEVYGVATDGSQLLLDVWPAATGGGDTGRRPALVRLHGGGWVEGVRSDMPVWNQWLNEQGFHVFDVTYRMNTRWLWCKCAARGHACRVRCAAVRL
jgi:acetyl esterase/lipase